MTDETTSLDWDALDAQWRQRHEAAQLASVAGALDAALASQGEAAEHSLLWRWARLSHFRAMQANEANVEDRGGAVKSRDQRSQATAQEYFAAGARAAERAVRLQPGRVEGHFWHGVNLIEAGRAGGTLAAARALPGASRHSERALQIDETYHFAGPLRVAGRLMHLRPLLLGGSVDRALDIYRRAIQIAPDNSTTLLYFVEALLADRQPRVARGVLASIVAAPPAPDWMWEQERDRRLAAALLQKITAQG